MDPFIGCDKKRFCRYLLERHEGPYWVFVGNFQQHLFISQLSLGTLHIPLSYKVGSHKFKRSSTDIRLFPSIYLLLRGGHERNPMVIRWSANMYAYVLSINDNGIFCCESGARFFCLFQALSVARFSDHQGNAAHCCGLTE